MRLSSWQNWDEDAGTGRTGKNQVCSYQDIIKMPKRLTMMETKVTVFMNWYRVAGLVPQMFVILSLCQALTVEEGAVSKMMSLGSCSVGLSS